MHIQDMKVSERNQAVSFASNAGGQVLRRAKASSATLNPIDQHYYADGVEVGFLTNDGQDSSRADYAAALQQRSWSAGPGSFRWGTVNPVTEGDFGGAGFQPLNPHHEAMGNGSVYSAQGGETLQQVAAMLWGDSSR